MRVLILPSNEVTAANAGKRLGFAGKSRVGLSPRPGVAEFRRSARFAHHTPIWTRNLSR